jgi:N4-gp56 family major capsid protein
MAYVEILTTHGLSEEQWNNDIFEEYIGMMWWKNLMGTSEDSIIYLDEDLTKEPGDAITVGIMGQMQGGKVVGNAKAKGNEGRVDFYYQRLTIDNVRHVIKVEDIPMSQKRVGFRLLEKAKRALQTKSQLDLDEEITTQLSNNSDTAHGRVRGRYLYGALDSNWNATHSVALTAVDNAADQLTTNMIDICKRKALIPVNATAKIRPMRVKNGKNYEEWFTFCGHTYSIRDMVNNDAAWRNAQLNIPPGSNSDSPLFTGSSFKGSWNGTLIYEYERINLVSSTIQVAHNLFLGAQAAAVVWGQRSKFGEEESDIGHDMTFEAHEIRGVERLYFDRATVEDSGVVHCFSAAVAD